LYKTGKIDFSKLWIFGAVKAGAVRYLKKNAVEHLSERLPSVLKNYENINALVEGEEFLATDLDHCYWRIAYNEGVIRKELYERLNVSEFKQNRNQALACLTTTKKKHYYKEGVFSHTEIIGDSDLAMLYENVIRQKCFQIMNNAVPLCKKGFIMYKTDCIYYKPEQQEIIEAHFMANNMLFKTSKCIYLGNQHYMDDKDIKKF
jgi:hypothetical protein